MLYSLLLPTIFAFTLLQPIHAEVKAPPSTKPDHTLIRGDWQRTDGSYLIRVSNVQADGQAKVDYFNPNPIHVADSSISIQKNLIKLFIKFQDKGYEGSTYTLYYYKKKMSLWDFTIRLPWTKRLKLFL